MPYVQVTILKLPKSYLRNIPVHLDIDQTQFGLFSSIEMGYLWIGFAGKN